jgi:hypothetical protein
MELDFAYEGGIAIHLSGIDVPENIKNQLTRDMTSFIMPIGLVLVLKWYFPDSAENTFFCRYQARPTARIAGRRKWHRILSRREQASLIEVNNERT